MECVFCKIINKEIPAKVVWENDRVLAFENIKPVHPVHVLIIPKKHIASIQEAEAQDGEYLSQILLAVSEIAKIKGVAQSGYRLIMNTGADGRQEVAHMHLHLLGGRRMQHPLG